MSRRHRRSLVKLTTLSWVVVALAAAAATTVSAQDKQQGRAKIEREGDCFRFSSYNAWIQFIKDKGAANPNFSLEQFSRRFTREAYEDASRSISCSFFTYSVDGVQVGGFSARARQAGGAKVPVIVYNHGGSGEASRVNFGQMLEDIFPLTAAGFFVVGSQYRDDDEFGGKDVDDVLALFDVIDARNDVLADRIGMMGVSRGGIMTMLAASRSARVNAIALIGTPTDLLQGLKSRPDMERVFEKLIPDYATQKEAALLQRSPLFSLDKIDRAVPILILHGGADDRAPADHALALATKLQNQERTYGLRIFPGGDHGLTNFKVEARADIVSWFRTYLQNRP